jgi:hypothetical protein
MSDEAEQMEIETVFSDGELALAGYGSHTAELAQAFGNLLVQASRIPADHWLAPIAITMLEKVAGSVETKPKGALKSLTKD